MLLAEQEQIFLLDGWCIDPRRQVGHGLNSAICDAIFHVGRSEGGLQAIFPCYIPFRCLGKMNTPTSIPSPPEARSFSIPIEFAIRPSGA